MTINKPEKQGKGWRNRFDRRFKIVVKDRPPETEAEEVWLVWTKVNEKVKDFISSELTKAKSETIQSVLACRPEKDTTPDADEYERGDRIGFNSALEEWEKKIKEKVGI